MCGLHASNIPAQIQSQNLATTVRKKMYIRAQMAVGGLDFRLLHHEGLEDDRISGRRVQKSCLH